MLRYRSDNKFAFSISSSMKKVSLLFCIHNHQPVGNSEHVFLETNAKAYAPFLSLLEKLSSIKILLAHENMALHEKQEQPALVNQYLQEFPRRAE